MTLLKSSENYYYAHNMKFYNFPKKQDYYLIYTSYKLLQTRLFSNLYIQTSSKDSLFFRFMKSDIGFILSYLLSQKIDVPKVGCEYIGIIKQGKIILFEIENNEAIAVWRKDVDDKWERSEFLGYQLLSEYTVSEFNAKIKLIDKALRIHWDSVNENVNNIHGDLTHFNILYGAKEELFFIDERSDKHSKLFDFYNFYTYLRKCLSNCVTLNPEDEKVIVDQLDLIVGNICNYKSENEMKRDIENMNIPEFCILNGGHVFSNDFIKIIS